MEKITPLVFKYEELLKKANNNDGLSCYILARSYDSGENGLEKSSENALFWYKRGHELNDPRCTYGLGACYFFGDGVKEDKNKAYELFVEAYEPLLRLIDEEKDNPKKQAFSKFCLGAYYYFGFGDIKKDDSESNS